MGGSKNTRKISTRIPLTAAAGRRRSLKWLNANVFGGANKPRRFMTPPVLYGGRIYCRNYAGDPLCIDARK